MHQAGVDLLWIDAHCIRQGACNHDDCVDYDQCIEKLNAIQAMDLVYQLSNHPVALLGRPLKSTNELQLLAGVLEGRFVTGELEHRLSAAYGRGEAMEALLLLRRITNDRWWSRAWTFQENYRGRDRMKLLIRHDKSLESQKRLCSSFGKIPGELCIWSVHFSKEATRLCLALRKVTGLSRLEREQIDLVLRAAGRYKLLLSASSPMTSTVITDIEKRGCSNSWDRLAIVANCCRYRVRPDHGPLIQKSHSLSLSVLAMCLLNGEILDNSQDSLPSVAELTVSEFIKRVMFRKFNAPENDPRPLTYNKGSRLVDVEITRHGIKTRGHLWKLGCVVNTANFPPDLPWIEEAHGNLNLHERKALLQLAIFLKDTDDFLADQIYDYLNYDANSVGKRWVTFTEKHLYDMAVELAVAILARQELMLGKLWNNPWQPSYSAVFVLQETEYNGPSPSPSFAFISVMQGQIGSQQHDANDLDYNASLAVDIQGSAGGEPRLRVQNWLHGMCFFQKLPAYQSGFSLAKVAAGSRTVRAQRYVRPDDNVGTDLYGNNVAMACEYKRSIDRAKVR